MFSICWGYFCSKHFWKDTNILKKWDRLLQHWRFQENMESRKIIFFSACSALPLPFSPVSSFNTILRGSSWTIWRGKEVSKQEFWQPHQHRLASINAKIEIDHHDDGNVLIARELLDTLVAKNLLGHPDTLTKGCFILARISLWCLKVLTILDHIAEMLRFISNTQSFWFTLDTSYNHGWHLANRFRLESNDYEALLIVA